MSIPERQEHTGKTHASGGTIVLDAEGMAGVLEQVARDIANSLPDMEHVALLGILSRGRPLAERLAERIEAMTGTRPKVGALATTLYRDDLRTGKGRLKAGGEATYFGFNIDGLTVVLIDDVVHKGRTVRAALDELMDYGRPACVQLAALIDRGGRELPIQPDYCGWSIGAESADRVAVRMRELDGEDAVILERGEREPAAGSGDAGEGA